MKTNHVLLLICLLFLLFFSSVVVVAEELKPEARESFDKGMLAVGQKEWPTAIRYFLKAQEKAPYAPEVLFNLGLAESKVHGRELRSMAWFRAYLAKSPNTANAEAVRKEIAGLEIRIEATIDKLINQTMQLVAQFSDEDSRRVFYRLIAIAQARAGDIPGAKQTAAKDNKWNSTAELVEIAVIQYHAGDAAGAENTIREIGRGSSLEKPYATQSHAYGLIAYLQAIKGEFSQAEASIEKEMWDGDKPLHYLHLACEEALAGRQDQALAHIAKALDINNKLAENDRSLKLGWVEDLQGYLGDIDGAKKTYLLQGQRIREITGPFKPEAYANSDYRMHIIERPRGILKFIGDQRLLKVKPDKSVPLEKYVEWTRFIQNKLNDELFTDQQSALRTIAGKGKSYEIVSGMLEAIDAITNRFNEIKSLSRDL